MCRDPVVKRRDRREPVKVRDREPGRDHWPGSWPYHVANGKAKKLHEAGPVRTPTPCKKNRFGIWAGHHKTWYNPHAVLI